VVTTIELFSVTSGRVYLIPLVADNFILAQVGYGGDLGVFDTLVKIDVNIDKLCPTVLFRVHYGLVSQRKFNWVDKGMFPFFGSLCSPYPYLHQAVGDDECYLVIYGAEDRIVSCTEASEYEPLAVWSHEHIIDRFRQSASLRGSST
jgi:hypothetical protein